MTVVTPTLAPQTSRWQVPRVDPRERWVGGVAAAIAREIGVQPLVIRGSFAVLALEACRTDAK